MRTASAFVPRSPANDQVLDRDRGPLDDVVEQGAEPGFGRHRARDAGDMGQLESPVSDDDGLWDGP